jgi:hypothetical protein
VTVVHCGHGCSHSVASRLGDRFGGDRGGGRDGLCSSRLLERPTLVVPPISGQAAHQRRGGRIALTSSAMFRSKKVPCAFCVLGNFVFNNLHRGSRNVPTGNRSTEAPVITIGEEEISDVSLATFYFFDNENAGAHHPGLQLARGGRVVHRGRTGCAVACGGCGGGGCGSGGGGCGGASCASAGGVDGY